MAKNGSPPTGRVGGQHTLSSEQPDIKSVARNFHGPQARISEATYFSMTDAEKAAVPRDAMGKPCGYWSWSTEGWSRYYRENPREPNAGPPRQYSHSEQRKAAARPSRVVDAAAFAKAESDRSCGASRWPDEYRDGARSAAGLPVGPREAGDKPRYPRGFHEWPLERRNAWFAGFNGEYSRRARDDDRS